MFTHHFLAFLHNFSSLSIFKTLVLKSLSITSTSSFFSESFCWCSFSSESVMLLCFFLCLVILLFLNTGHLNLVMWLLWNQIFLLQSLLCCIIVFVFLLVVSWVYLYWGSSLGINLRSSHIFSKSFLSYAWLLSNFPHIWSCFWMS